MDAFSYEQAIGMPLSEAASAFPVEACKATAALRIEHDIEAKAF